MEIGPLIMSYSDWVERNIGLVIVLLIFLGFIVFDKFIRPWWDIRKQKKDGFQKMPPTQPEQQTKPSFDDIIFEKEFEETEQNMRSNYSKLCHERDMLQKQIEENITLYKSTKDKYEKSYIMMERLSKHIPNLKSQWRAADEQIRRMQNEQRKN